jgi:hypothetical protein
VKRKNGRAKGKIAEREVARKLEAWWGQIEPGCRFKPTPMSGGWSSPDVRESFKTSGDLVTTASRFPFCIEVKRREGWSWSTLRAGKPSPVRGWWEQAYKQAEEMRAEPLLIFRHNHECWWMIGRIDYFTFTCEGLVRAKVGFNPWRGVFAVPLACLETSSPKLFVRSDVNGVSPPSANW